MGTMFPFSPGLVQQQNRVHALKGGARYSSDLYLHVVATVGKPGGLNGYSGRCNHSYTVVHPSLSLSFVDCLKPSFVGTSAEVGK